MNRNFLVQENGILYVPLMNECEKKSRNIAKFIKGWHTYC